MTRELKYRKALMAIVRLLDLRDLNAEQRRQQIRHECAKALARPRKSKPKPVKPDPLSDIGNFSDEL